MPLHILAVLVVLGLAMVIGLVHIFGGASDCGGLDADTAKQRFETDFPRFETTDCIVADDGETAVLLSRNGGEVGLVSGIGRNWLTRLIDGKMLADVDIDEAHVNFRLHDFTVPAVDLRVRDRAQIELVAQNLRRLKGEDV